MYELADNSFFRQNYKGLDVLVLVPHEDDEILTAGMLIPVLTKSGANVTIVFATNGDWKYPAKIRVKEAVNSAAELGVPKENIIIMGYGDSVASEEKSHLFYHDGVPAVSAAGFSETYGIADLDDYAFSSEHIHHKYTNKNYLKDLISIIKNIHPGLIICTDFDEHPDHRMLSLYFDKAIGIIKKDEPEYSPEVLKRFAYSLAYNAEPDFTSVNNAETKKPCISRKNKYNYDFIDTFIYGWKSRIRFPVPADARIGNLRNNLIVNALNKHRSQFVITRADRIINSDEVYWNRRTDSVSYNADIFVSSGNGSYLNDFIIYSVENVDDIIPAFSDCFWKPDQDDSEKKAVFRWKKPVDIQFVSIIYSSAADSCTKEVSVSFSDGSFYKLKNFTVNDNQIIADLGMHYSITECTVRIDSAAGDNFAISEIEFYTEQQIGSQIHPFCKITVNDNFAYEYYIDDNVSVLPVDVYTYGNTGRVTITVISGDAVIIDHELHIRGSDSQIILKAENESGSVFDKIVIRKLTDEEKRKSDLQDKNNRKYISSKKRGLKIHNMLYILKHQGILAVIKRTYGNTIKPVIRK